MISAQTSIWCYSISQLISLLRLDKRYCILHDKAWAHMAQETMNVLNEFFDNRLIGVGLWPPYSLDLTSFKFLRVPEGSCLPQPPTYFDCFVDEHHLEDKCNYNVLCVLYFGLPKRYPFFYKGRASRQLVWQYPAAWLQRNSPFLYPAILSSFFLIRPFPINFNSSFSCPRPAVANKKKVGWPWNWLHPAYFLQLLSLLHPLAFIQAKFARTLFWLFSTGLFQP